MVNYIIYLPLICIILIQIGPTPVKISLKRLILDQNRQDITPKRANGQPRPKYFDGFYFVFFCFFFDKKCNFLFLFLNFYFYF